jgi:hypothetical protein
LTPSVKPLGLILVIAPIGMLDLSSTLTLTPSGKWALVEVGSSLFFTLQQPFVGLAYQGKDIELYLL